MTEFIYSRDNILEETDPNKLHVLATKIIKKNIKVLGVSDSISFASFLEARAAYLNTKRYVSPNTGPK